MNNGGNEMKRMLFVYNPNAGKGVLKAKLADVVDIFVKADYEVVIYPTQCYQDALNKVAKLEDGYDLVVCGGGDGTLDEVVTGMMKRSPIRRIPIGYIPAGTTNDFANSLHISRDVLKAAHAAVGIYIDRWSGHHYLGAMLDVLIEIFLCMLQHLDYLQMFHTKQIKNLKIFWDILHMY